MNPLPKISDLFSVSPADSAPLFSEDHAEWQMVTPLQARRLLASSTPPRDVQTTLKAKRRIVVDMQANRYMPSFCGLVFDERGELLGGHEYLMAVVETGKTVPVRVVTLLQPEVLPSPAPQSIEQLAAQICEPAKPAAPAPLPPKNHAHEAINFIAEVAFGQSASDDDRKAVALLFSNLAERVEHLIIQRRLPISRAPVRAAVILRAHEYSDSTRVLQAYRELCAGRAEKFRAAQAALANALEALASRDKGGNDRSGRQHAFALAYAAFKPEAMKRKHLKVGTGGVEIRVARQYVERLIKGAK